MRDAENGGNQTMLLIDAREATYASETYAWLQNQMNI